MYVSNRLGYHQINWVDVKSNQIESSNQLGHDIKSNDYHALQLFIANSTVYVSNRLGYYQISWVDVKPNDRHALQLFIANSTVCVSNQLGYHQISWVDVKSNQIESSNQLDHDVKSNDHHALKLFIANSTVYVSNRLGYHQINWVDVKSNHQINWAMMSNRMTIILCNCLFPIQLCMYQIDWAVIKSIGLMSNQIKSNHQINWVMMSNRMTIMLCTCLLPIQLCMYQIDCAIIKSIGLMSNRMIVILWTIIHDTLRTDSASFSNKVRTTPTTLGCEMLKSLIFVWQLLKMAKITHLPSFIALLYIFFYYLGLFGDISLSIFAGQTCIRSIHVP